MLLRLILTDVTCQLTHLNTRSEKLGPKEYQPAADLKLEAIVPGETLDSFNPALLDQLFKRDLASPVPRDSGIVYPISHDGEMHECEVVIANGVDNVMKFQDSKVNNFHLTPMKGGFVKMTFRVQCHPKNKEAGELYGLQMKTVTISVTPPPVKEKPETKAPRAAKSTATEKDTSAPAVH